MKKILALVLIFLPCITMIGEARGEMIFNETFDWLDNGNLINQNSWEDELNGEGFQVSENLPYEGAKGINVTESGSDHWVKRVIGESDTERGTVKVKIRANRMATCPLSPWRRQIVLLPSL